MANILQVLLQALKAVLKTFNGRGSRRIGWIEWEEEFGLVKPLVSVLLLMLSTNVCRCDFQLSTSTPGSKDPVGPFQGASMWLRSVCAC